METKRLAGRPSIVNYKIINKLTDALQHSESITDACAYAGISRDTYYRHLQNEIFAKKMAIAQENQNKVIMNFLTIF